MTDIDASFVDLLYTGAARVDFDRLVEAHPERAGEYDVALRLRDLIAGALAPIIAIKLLGAATEGDTNVNLVAIYMTIGSVITLIAVYFAKETRASSLRHDRVLPDAH